MQSFARKYNTLFNCRKIGIITPIWTWLVSYHRITCDVMLSDKWIAKSDLREIVKNVRRETINQNVNTWS